MATCVRPRDCKGVLGSSTNIALGPEQNQIVILVTTLTTMKASTLG